MCGSSFLPVSYRLFQFIWWWQPVVSRMLSHSEYGAASFFFFILLRELLCNPYIRLLLLLLLVLQRHYAVRTYAHPGDSHLVLKLTGALIYCASEI